MTTRPKNKTKLKLSLAFTPSPRTSGYRMTNIRPTPFPLTGTAVHPAGEGAALHVNSDGLNEIQHLSQTSPRIFRAPFDPPFPRPGRLGGSGLVRGLSRLSFVSADPV